MKRLIGVLTSGGDCPGLNAAIRGVGRACMDVYGVMMALRGTEVMTVALADVAGKKKLVPLDHPWVQTARHVGTCLGDEQ
jgi:6-phosphofructokinase 1